MFFQSPTFIIQIAQPTVQNLKLFKLLGGI